MEDRVPKRRIRRQKIWKVFTMLAIRKCKENLQRIPLTPESSTETKCIWNEICLFVHNNIIIDYLWIACYTCRSYSLPTQLRTNLPSLSFPKYKYNLCSPHTHWSIVRLSVASPLQITDTFPKPQPEANKREGLHFSIFITLLKDSLLSGNLSRLFVSALLRRGVVIAETFKVSPMSMELSIPLWQLPPWV